MSQPSATPALSGRELGPVVAAALAIAAIAWAMPAGAAWVSGGRVPPAVSAVEGTGRLVTKRHWVEPASAYPADARRGMPRRPEDWWAGAAWAAVTLTAAGIGTWRRLDISAARARLGRRDFDVRGSRPRDWARRRDLAALIVRRRTPDRFTLGTLERALLASDPEAHVAVIAPTRSGKTTRCVIPWLLEHPGPVVVTSTKTDVLDVTRAWRERLGRVSVWDPFGPESTNWTPLTGCTDWSRALQQAQWLADAAQQGDSEIASYWRGEAARLLAPLLHAAAVADVGLAHVLAWIDGQDTKRPAAVLDAAGTSEAARQLAGIAALDSRNRGTIYMSAGSLLAAYRYPDVQRTATDGFTPSAFLDGAPNTLYIVASSRQQRLLAAPAVALLSGLLHHCAEHANEHGPLTPTLRVLLDETANIAPIRDLPAHLSQAAGHGIRIATVWQSLAQARERYGPATDSILANSTAKLYLGPVTDTTTRRHISELLGEHPTTSTTVTTTGALRRSTSESRAWRNKADAAALQQLGNDRALLVEGASPPGVIDLTPWWEATELRRRATWYR